MNCLLIIMPRRKYFKRLELLLCIMLVLVVVIVWILQSHLVYNVDHSDITRFRLLIFYERCPVFDITRMWWTFFGKKLALTGDPLWKWLEKRTKINDHFFLYDNKMALLYDVVVDPSRRSLGRLGGEDMKDVWDQEEAVEYLELKHAKLDSEWLYYVTRRANMADSASSTVSRYGEKDHLNQWQESLKCVSDVKSVKTSHTVSGLTIALQR
nr:hypothetical protein BaRGS_030547 [Batillaria attramentaria]